MVEGVAFASRQFNNFNVNKIAFYNLRFNNLIIIAEEAIFIFNIFITKLSAFSFSGF